MLLARGAKEVQKEERNLVAREQAHLTEMVHGNAQTVRIWVGSNGDICPIQLSSHHGKVHGVWVLWVGFGACGERAVRFTLRVDDLVSDAAYLEDLLRRLKTGPVQGRIHHLDA